MDSFCGFGNLLPVKIEALDHVPLHLFVDNASGGSLFAMEKNRPKWCTPPKTNISPEKCWLEDELSFWNIFGDMLIWRGVVFSSFFRVDVTEFDPKVYEVDKISIKCPRDTKWLWWIFDSNVCWFLLKLNGYFGVTWSGMFNESFQLSYLSSFCSLSSSHRWRWMQCIWWLPQWQRIPPLRLLCPRPSWTSFLKKSRGTITGCLVFFLEHELNMFISFFWVLESKNTSTSPLKDWHIQCQFFREFGESDKFLLNFSVIEKHAMPKTNFNIMASGNICWFWGKPKTQQGNLVPTSIQQGTFTLYSNIFHDYFIIFHYESLEFLGHQEKLRMLFLLFNGFTATRSSVVPWMRSLEKIHSEPSHRGFMDVTWSWRRP